MSESRTLTANSVASVLGTVVSALLSVVYISLGARWLGPAEYGNVGALIALGNVLQLALSPLEAGLTLSIATHSGRGEQAELALFARGALRALLVLSLPLALAWALASLLAARLGAHYPLLALVLVGLFFIAGVVICLPRAVLRGRELFVPLSLNIGVESALRLALGVALLQLFHSAAAMVAGYALATWFAVIHSARAMAVGLPAPAVSAARSSFALAELTRPFRSLSAPLMGVHLYSALLVNLDVLAAKHYLPAHDAGLYAGAAAISRIVAVGATPILLVLFSRLANLSAARASTQRTLRLGAAAIACGLFASLIVPAFFGELLLRASLGSAYVGAERVLLIQWASACVLTLQTFFADALLATSRMRAPFLLLLPVFGMLLGLWLFHDSPSAIAEVSLTVGATLGTGVFYTLWRLRAPVPHA
ncbi:MAG TPA: oligosaccharide flippase family protein [Polyangiales bacterium]